MIVSGEENPYHSFPARFIAGLGEVPLAGIHLYRSVQQRQISVETAQSWLDSAVQDGLEYGLDDVFCPEDIGTEINAKIGSGFATSAFSFKTSQGEWVLKIGAKNAPVPGWFAPSSREYASWYARNLQLLRSSFDEQLPHAIPHPQYVMHTNNQDARTTLIIQPHIANFETLGSALLKERPTRVVILNELEIFYRAAERLRKSQRVIPDLGSSGNLVLSKTEGQHHLTLIDNGVIDYSAPAPVMSMYNTVRYHLRLRRAISRIRSSLE